MRWLLEQLLATDGKEYCDNDNGRQGLATKVQFDQETAVRVAQWWTDLVKGGYATNTLAVDQRGRPQRQGEAGRLGVREVRRRPGRAGQVAHRHGVRADQRRGPAARAAAVGRVRRLPAGRDAAGP
ncbi:hypothetical protein GCM10010429_22610 [Micromonospora olivasterospora]